MSVSRDSRRPSDVRGFLAKGAAAAATAAVLAACNGGGGAPTPLGAPVGGTNVVSAPTATPAPSASKTPGVGASPAVTAAPGKTSAPGATASPVATATPIGAATSQPVLGPSAGNPFGGSNGQAESDFFKSCGTASLGQTVTQVYASGVINTASVFTATDASWTKANYTLATPEPTSTPTDAPEPTPISYTPEYIYFGHYTVFNGGSTDTSSCAFIEARQDLAPLDPDSLDNSFAAGLVLPPANGNANFVSHGKITSFTISNIGPSSGSGNFTLDNGETGTISISGREAYQSPNYATEAMSVLRRKYR